MEKMDNEQSQLVAFTIISYSGMARALIHEAMDALRKGNFELAHQKMKEADEQLVQAHQAQTDLLQKFASGVEIEIQIIMVHAQDHLMTTMTLKEVAKEMESVYKQIYELKDLLAAQAA